MKPSQTIRFGIATTVLVLLLASCVVHPSVPSSASGSSSSSSTSESTTSPPTEQTTGLEPPQSPTNGAPSLSLAPAPTAIASAWGVTYQSGDKTVWFLLPVPGQLPASQGAADWAG